MNRMNVGMYSLIVMMACSSFANGQNYKPVSINLDVDEKKLDAILELRVPFRFRDKTLEEVLLAMSQEIDMPIFLDEKALSEAGLGPEAPVSMSTPPIAFRAGFTWMLDQLDLTWLPGSGGLIVTTRDGASERLITRIYPVYDLIKSKVNGRSSLDYDTLMEIIESIVDPDTWENNGGEGAIEPFNGSLVVSQIWDVHHKIENVLSALRTANGQAPADWKNVVADDARSWKSQYRANTPRRSLYLFPMPNSTIRTHR